MRRTVRDFSVAHSSEKISLRRTSKREEKSESRLSPPSLASAELMFGKRDDTSDPVRLRTREDRAANTKCAPRMSHSVFRHRLVAMLCSYNKLPTPISSSSLTTREKMFLSTVDDEYADRHNTVFQKPVRGHNSSNEPVGSSDIQNIASYRSKRRATDPSYSTQPTGRADGDTRLCARQLTGAAGEISSPAGHGR